MMRITAVLLFVVALAPPSRAQETAGSGSIPDLTFVHISDMRVDPRFAGEPEPKKIRGEGTFHWMGEELKKPQRIGEIGTSPPSFVVCTGDLTESGVPGETWKEVERLFAHLPVDHYIALGARDARRVPIDAGTHTLHPWVNENMSCGGGRSYAFDHSGVHFIVLGDSPVAAPYAAITDGDLEWLYQHFKQRGVGGPVILVCPQAPDDADMAQPWFERRLMSALDDANVMLLLYGHGRTAEHRVVQGIDCVQGPSTYSSSAEADVGYNIVSIKNGMLRVAFRSNDASRPAKLLLEKPVSKYLSVRPLFQMYDARAPSRTIDETDSFDRCMQLSILGRYAPEEAPLDRFVVLLDGQRLPVELHVGSPMPEATRIGCFRCSYSETTPTWEAFLQLENVAPGDHLLTLELLATDGVLRQQSRHCRVSGGPVAALWTENLWGATRGVAVESREQIAVAAENSLRYRRRSDGDSDWRVDHAEPYLGGPLGVCGFGDDALLVAGLTSCEVVARTRSTMKWIYDTGAAVHAAPAIVDGVVYIGDDAGRMHAIDVKTGRSRWISDTHGFGIEAKPCVTPELVVFGAWNGYVYAVNRSDGSPAWKHLGPKSSADAAHAPDCAPAQCAPVAIGDRIFVCDAGYALAWYSPTGEMHAVEEANVAAIGATEDGSMLLLRGTDDVLTLMTADAKVVWKSKVALGKFPVPPIEKNGIVYICSDRGLVSWVDARDGTVLATYRATAGAYVNVPLAVDDTHVCYVAGMDGSLSALRLKSRPGLPEKK